MKLGKTQLRILVRKLKAYAKSPIPFIFDQWGLIPQPAAEGYEILVGDIYKRRAFSELKPYYFVPFQKGKHITWQQTQVLKVMEYALNGGSVKRISIRSGHGTGKTCVLAWLILWYLFTFKNAQIPCTAPTSVQMHDVAWKELKYWIDKMPPEVAEQYEHTGNYVRIIGNPEIWFARAATARKEAPEALAGIHGEHVLYIVDEGSGVPQEIFNTAEGSLTNADAYIVMASNPTRLVGYFYDTHHSDKAHWQTVHLNSEESPIVDHSYIERMEQKHGRDSDEYAIRVLGNFPKADAVDDKGYVPLLVEQDLHICDDVDFIGTKRLGIDPSGEGSNKTIFVVRDHFKAKIVREDLKSNERDIAQKAMSLMELYRIAPADVFVDNFGAGANVAQYLAAAGKFVNAVNVGDKPDDTERFLNLRAEAYWRVKEWLRTGGELERDERWRQLLILRYRSELNGKLKMMSKMDMKKEGFESPDVADALMLTFVTEDTYYPPVQEETIFNKHAVV